MSEPSIEEIVARIESGVLHPSGRQISDHELFDLISSWRERGEALRWVKPRIVERYLTKGEAREMLVKIETALKDKPSSKDTFDFPAPVPWDDKP